MKAYSISWESRAPGSLDFGPDYFLPDVECEVCGEEWGEPGFSFPTVNPPWIEHYRYRESGDLSVIPFAKFMDLKKRLDEIGQSGGRVLPGAAIGPYSGRSTYSELPDLYFDASAFVANAKAKESLEGAGVSFSSIVPHILFKGKPLKGYYQLEIPWAWALSKAEKASLVEKECTHCGFMKASLAQLRRMRNCRSYSFRKEVLKTAPWMFAVREWAGATIASEEFMMLVRDLKLSGLEFEICGKFV